MPQGFIRGLEISRLSGIQIIIHMFLGQGVLSALNVNDSSTAAKMLDQMGSSLGRFKPWTPVFTIFWGPGKPCSGRI